MKKLILLFGIVLSIFTFSQETKENLNEEQPYFSKGNQEFRNMISKNFRTDKIQSVGNQNIHCELRFIVDKEGDVIEVKAFGDNKGFNEEAEYAISQIKEKWIPGKINGVPVRSRFKIPLDIRFENEDTQPTYFRGNDDFINMLKAKISSKKIEGKGNIHSELSFIVNADESISDINVTGNNESFNKEIIKAVSKVKGRWNPGYKNGKPAPMNVRIPIDISI